MTAAAYWIWPAALLLCVLCMVGVIGAAYFRHTETPEEKGRGTYPVWLQNAIAYASEPVFNDKEATDAATAKQRP